MLGAVACSQPQPQPLLIVGAGPAGLAASIEAAASGPVVLLEAAERAGGSAIWATGVTVLPLRPGGHPHLDALRTDGVDWLTEQGVAFGPTAAPAPRGFQSLQPVGGGAQLAAVLIDKAKRAGVQLRTGCAVEALVPGDVWTVKTDSCGSFSSPVLVLATGGVLGDDAARQAWLGEPTPRLSPATTARTGLALTKSLGAARFDEGRVLWFDHVSPISGLGRTLAAPPSAVALSATGERLSGALRGYGPGLEGVAWAIVSGVDRGRSQLFDIALGQLVPLSQHVSEGGGFEADTVADVALRTGISEDMITAALRRRTPRGPGGLPSGPHAVVRLERAAAKQLGGLQTDAQGRVLSPAGRPLPGLFAAGELTGFHGLHAGHTPVDSTMVVGAVVTGRIAGREAMRSAALRPGLFAPQD